MSRKHYIVSMVLFSLFALFGIIGNNALLFVILKAKLLWNAPNILLCNLTLADLLYIIVTGPIRIEHEVNPCWFQGQLLCRLRFYAPVVCHCACVYSLVVLSREMYLPIASEIHSRKRNGIRITIFWTILSWTLGIIIATPMLSKNFVTRKGPLEGMFIVCQSALRGSKKAVVYRS